MTKKISVLLAFVTLLFADLALAQGAAVVANLVGTAQVQTGTATPRILRLGDQVLQGDTVSTGASSNLVLRFDDGEVTALTQNSRMTVTAYQYEPSSRTGNMLLSLVRGGMRAVTGLLGASHPERVAYRAATTTIGIRGTDVEIATDGNEVVVTVVTGEITILVAGQSLTLHAGESATINAKGITAGINGTPSNKQTLLEVNASQIADALNAALSSASGTGTGAPAGSGTGIASGATTPGGGGSGGGSVSVH